jgi:pimeloyl-ACP methyl ester carboxylesterase
MRQVDDRPHLSEPVKVQEEAAFFGADQRGFSILTLPGRQARANLPVVVFLNGGLLHRVGPYRLYVRMARELAELGFSSLRVDLTGRGDTVRRKTQSYQEAIAEDYADIKSLLNSRFGNVPVILFGLCSGTDDAIRLAAHDRDVVGMVLLDPVCFKQAGYTIRALKMTALECVSHPVFHIQLFLRRLKKLRAGKKWINPLDVRQTPSLDQVRDAITGVGDRGGRVLSVYTRYATRFYNREGQMKSVLNYADYDRVCTELFWPDVSHTYLIDVHRRRLLDTVSDWARKFRDEVRTART